MIRVATRFPGLIPFMIGSPLLVLARGFAARCAVRLCLTVRNPFRKDREATPRDTTTRQSLKLIKSEPSGKPEAFRTSGGRAAKQYQLTVAVFTQVMAGKPSLIAVHESPPSFEPKNLPLRVPQ